MGGRANNRVVVGEVLMNLLRPAVIGWLGVLVCLGGCASKKDMDVLQRQIWSMHRDLKNIDSQIAQLEKRVDGKIQDLSNRFEADSQPLRRNQATVGAQLDRMELEIGRLSGQVEEIAGVNTSSREKISDFQQRQMSSMLEMQKAVDDLDRRLSRVANFLGLQELAASPKEKPEVEEKVSESVQVVAPVKTAEGQETARPEAFYEQAFQLFRTGDFQAARDGFSRYLERYPNTDLADNAQFWLGECYYGEKNYEKAIAAYEKVIKKYPTSDKVSSALLKEGMAFLELGDKTAAKILLKKVVKEYPQSNQAQIAQSKLSQVE